MLATGRFSIAMIAAIISVIIFCGLYYFSNLFSPSEPELITNSTPSEQIKITHRNTIESTIQSDETGTENIQTDENIVSPISPPQNNITNSAESITYERQSQPVVNPNERLTNNINHTQDRPNLRESKYKSLAQNNFKPYFNKEFPNSNLKSHITTKSNDSDLSRATKAFLRGEWNRSINQYQQIPNINKYKGEYLQLGFAYLNISELEKASTIFIELKKTYKWSDKAQWYLLLTYLSGGENYQIQFNEELEQAIQNTDLDKKTRDRIIKLKADYIASKAQ